jgi:hypothetical protein
MNPSWAVGSGIRAVYGNTEGGSTQITSNHATIWTGTAGSALDVHPAGFADSLIAGLDANSQVGYGRLSTGSGSPTFALLWHGTAESYVNLHPTAYHDSELTAVSGNTQVGYVSAPTTSFQAGMWSGTAESFVNLNPSGTTLSLAVGVSDSYQVGYGAGPGTASRYHAFRWSGSAASALDLHQFTTGLTFNGAPLSLVATQAFGIDSNGDIIGVGTDSASHNYALLWRPVPEPASCLLLGLGVLALLRRRR